MHDAAACRPPGACCQNPSAAVRVLRPGPSHLAPELWIISIAFPLARRRSHLLRVLPTTPSLDFINWPISTSWRRLHTPLPGQNGEAHKEPLGAPHHPGGQLLYDPSSPDDPLLTAPRPGRCLARGLLLAQDLLGLPHHQSRRRRQAHPHPAARQHRLRPRHVRARATCQAARRHPRAPEHRVPLDADAAAGPARYHHVPGHQRRSLLPRRRDHVLLGLQRRRGALCCVVLETC
jgi:hypothetical protein